MVLCSERSSTWIYHHFIFTFCQKTAKLFNLLLPSDRTVLQPSNTVLFAVISICHLYSCKHSQTIKSAIPLTSDTNCTCTRVWISNSCERCWCFWKRRTNDWCVCKGKGCSGSSRTEVVRLKLEVSPGDEDASQGFGGAPQQRWHFPTKHSRFKANSTGTIHTKMNLNNSSQAATELQPGFYLQDLNAHALLFSFPLTGIHCPQPRGVWAWGFVGVCRVSACPAAAPCRLWSRGSLRPTFCSSVTSPLLPSSAIAVQINSAPCWYKYWNVAFQIEEILVYIYFVWQIGPCFKVCL